MRMYTEHLGNRGRHWTPVHERGPRAAAQDAATRILLYSEHDASAQKDIKKMAAKESNQVNSRVICVVRRGGILKGELKLTLKGEFPVMNCN